MVSTDGENIKSPPTERYCFFIFFLVVRKILEILITKATVATYVNTIRLYLGKLYVFSLFVV